MQSLSIVLKELRELQSRLKQTVNRLWTLQSTLGKVYAGSEQENGFLLRRTLQRKHEEQLQFESCMQKLNQVIQSHLGRGLIMLTSAEDAKIATNIRTTLRYIQNAYATELPLLQRLTQLNRLLPQKVQHKT